MSSDEEEEEIPSSYNDLNLAIKAGDLPAVRSFVENPPFLDVNGAPGARKWDRPITACTMFGGGRCLHIARYLLARGARGYDALRATAREAGENLEIGKSEVY